MSTSSFRKYVFTATCPWPMADGRWPFNAGAKAIPCALFRRECTAAFYERRGLASAAPPKITPVVVGGVYPPGHGFGHRRS